MALAIIAGLEAVIDPHHLRLYPLLASLLVLEAYLMD